MDATVIREWILLIPVVLIALTFHEFSHAAAAIYFGDETPRLAGRFTLNPLSHLDPVGTLLLFIAHFGWAKPVPVNPYYFRNPTRDMGIVALSGPASNLMQALLFGIIIRVLLQGDNIIHTSIGQFGLAFSILALEINLALCFFNLLPIFPLDGSRILGWLLPSQYHDTLVWLERYGPILLLSIFAFEWVVRIPIFSYILGIPISLASYLFTGTNFSSLMFYYRSALSGGVL